MTFGLVILQVTYATVVPVVAASLVDFFFLYRSLHKLHIDSTDVT